MGFEKALTSQAPVTNKQATSTPVKPKETQGHSLAALTTALTLPINYDLSTIPVSSSVFLLHLGFLYPYSVPQGTGCATDKTWLRFKGVRTQPK